MYARIIFGSTNKMVICRNKHGCICVLYVRMAESQHVRLLFIADPQRNGRIRSSYGARTKTMKELQWYLEFLLHADIRCDMIYIIAWPVWKPLYVSVYASKYDISARYRYFGIYRLVQWWSSRLRIQRCSVRNRYISIYI